MAVSGVIFNLIEGEEGIAKTMFWKTYVLRSEWVYLKDDADLLMIFIFLTLVSKKPHIGKHIYLLDEWRAHS